MGTGEEKPELRLVRLALDEVVHQGDGLGELVLAEDATGQAQLPLRGVGLEEQGVAEGGLGRDKVFLGDVGGAKQAEGVAVAAAELDGAGEGLDGGVRPALLELNQAEVFVGAEVGGELAGGTLQVFGSLVRTIELIGDGAEGEVKDGARLLGGLGPQFEVGLDHVGGGEVGDFGEGFLFSGGELGFQVAVDVEVFQGALAKILVCKNFHDGSPGGARGTGGRSGLRVGDIGGGREAWAQYQKRPD